MSMVELSKKDQNPGKEISGTFCFAYNFGLLALFHVSVSVSVRSTVSSFALKFIYSEKATKILRNLPLTFDQ